MSRPRAGTPSAARPFGRLVRVLRNRFHECRKAIAVLRCRQRGSQFVHAQAREPKQVSDNGDAARLKKVSTLGSKAGMIGKRYGGLAATVLLVAGCALPPEGTSPGDVARFQTAVETVGCQLVSEAEYLPVELQTGLSREQSTRLASYLVASNRAVRLSTGGIRMTTGACATQEVLS